jgi:hypothetical protein
MIYLMFVTIILRSSSQIDVDFFLSSINDKTFTNLPYMSNTASVL